MLLITAYQQIELTRQNIINFRNNFIGYFSKCPIVIVTTSEDDIGFKKLEIEFDNIFVIEFNNAPGSSTCDWFNFDPYNGNYLNWRHRFIPPRIFFSIEKGLHKCLELGYNKVLHLHSDTFWESSYEKNLDNIFTLLDNYMIIGDGLPNEDGGPTPQGIHMHPEGLFFNLDKCIQNNNYGLSYSRIFTYNTGFSPHNYCSPEALIGQYAAWCLDGVNITTKEQILSENYKNNVGIMMERPYHGLFTHGLNNIKAIQQDAK